MIKQKTGKCLDCGIDGPVTAKRCQNCYWKYRSTVKGAPVKKAKSTHISAKSEKQLERDIEYAKLRKEWLPKHSICQVNRIGCTVKATQIHHKKGREGDLLTDTSEWLAICHKCHTWITEHSMEAIEQGFSKSRHKI